MRPLYKILFSLCSTLICAAHSFKVFADCPVLSSLPAGGVVALHYRDEALDYDCDTWGLRGYVLLTDGKESNDYGAVYGCDICKDGYELTSSGGDVWIGSPAALCDYVYDDCQPAPTPEVQCTTDATCVAQYGFAVKSNAFVDVDGVLKGYYYWDVKCGADKKCGLYLRSGACGALCDGGYYSTCATAWSIAGSFGVGGCVACPLPDYECIENCDMLVTGGGNNSYGCVLERNPVWDDGKGIFTVGTGCSYLAS